MKTSEGSLLVEFASPGEAVRCAVELQRGMIECNIGAASDRRITFRVGIHINEPTAVGDDLVSRAVAALPVDTLATLIKPGTEIYGAGGNIAERIAALAEPGASASPARFGRLSVTSFHTPSKTSGIKASIAVHPRCTAM